ncbi:hypothetical protein KZ483_13750 [Paenibacillus sp. sptzw28]|uniref:hypothetical protein n=1 Tax=Paenibacillus sp. sptzw28 TaxID=715179 RepID=UPI001C6EE50A|nr:hypothetical protein [Paenibacillus sp. sptzw28]QYR19040.1 hypothetical protein KZ483_13750 [Paenibacillus sp. sptzw28]
MPIVLRHRTTGEIACGLLQNVYNFAYYGALWWDDKETAEERSGQALTAAGFEQASDWELLEVKEERLKLFNVKLNNDPKRQLIMEGDGTITVVKGRRNEKGDQS